MNTKEKVVGGSGFQRFASFVLLAFTVLDSCAGFAVPGGDGVSSIKFFHRRGRGETRRKETRKMLEVFRLIPVFNDNSFFLEFFLCVSPRPLR